jgi:hypothetical protein
VVLGSRERDATASEVEESISVRLEVFVFDVGTDKSNVSGGEQLLGIRLNGSVRDTGGLAGVKRVSEAVTESSAVSGFDSSNGGGSISVSRFQSGLLANIDELVILELLVGDNITQNLGELSTDMIAWL